MKTFLEMRADLENLQGLTLNSISGQATPFKIIQVDDANDRLILDVAGIQKSRPLDELRRIWAVMCEKPAAHVDSVLGGSGSARSQPETILANLPYVEWLQIEGKKNLNYSRHHERARIMTTNDETVRKARSQVPEAGVFHRKRAQYPLG